MKGEQPKIRFHELLIQPGLGFCRGVLPYNLLLFMLFIVFALLCFVRAEEGVGLLSLVSSLFVFAHEIVFRRTRLPKPIAEAYDALFEDVAAELSRQSFKDQAVALVNQVGHLVHLSHVVLDWILERVRYSVEFVVALLLSLLYVLFHLLVARTQLARDHVSFRRFLLLTQVHSVRAPSFLLN